MQSIRRAGLPGARELWNISGVNFDFSFAFQPIVNSSTQEIIAFEALVRGPGGEPSADVFAKVPKARLYEFDQACRLKAIALARRLNMQTRLNINLFPNALYRTTFNVRATLQASLECGFPTDRITFEVSEAKRLVDYTHLIDMFESYEGFGFQTAIDDFGTGYSGLKLLVEYQPNYIKLDRNLIANTETDTVRQAIVTGMGRICRQLAIEMVAEGVETAYEYHWLRGIGITIF